LILLLGFSTATQIENRVYGSQAASISKTFFGLSVVDLGNPLPWPLTVPVGTLGKTQGTEWNDVEPSNGTFDWTPLDNSISKAEGAGVNSFVYTFWSTPVWASSAPTQSCILTAIENITGCAAPPSKLSYWDAFVKAVVSRYKDQIQYYELGNEANLAETYSGNVSEMVTLAQHAYEDIKSIEPSAIVLSPSVSTIGVAPYAPGCNVAECWLAEYLQAGGGRYADGIAFHDYAYFSTNPTAVSLGIACTQGDIEQCAGSPLETVVGDLRSLLSTYGLAGKPIFDTEGGFPSDIISADLLGTAAEQAAYVSRWFVVQASENVSVAVWFSEFPTQGALAGFGTTSAQAEDNQAYLQTYSWLVGSSVTSPCSRSTGLWTCDLTLSDGEQGQIVFADSGNASLPYSPSSPYSKVQDLNGTTYPAKGQVDVGMAPVLFTSTPTTTTPEFPSASIPIVALVAVAAVAAVRFRRLDPPGA
jgi:polysaccharide biosynthesis protein PslG